MTRSAGRRSAHGGNFKRAGFCRSEIGLRGALPPGIAVIGSTVRIGLTDSATGISFTPAAP